MPENMVQVRANVDLYSTHSAIDRKNRNEEFPCPWLLAKQLEEAGKVKILKDVNAQADAQDATEAPATPTATTEAPAPVQAPQRPARRRR